MAEVASAFVSLMPSAKGFGSSMSRQIGPQISSAGKTAGSRFGRVFAYSSMSPLKAIGAAAVGLFAVQKVKDFFGSAISEARESQKVSAITAQVIKSTGGAAAISAAQVGRLSTAISNKTGIDDEAIQSGANLLLTFKNIKDAAGAGNDIFTQTTSIMTDMATAMGNEPKAAAIQLGKALNDPIKGISALSRVGVTFSEDQKKVIESLVASGDVAGAQKVILKELKSEFGGTAEAAATAGDKFHTTFANFQEAIGTALLPYLDRALTKGTEFISFLMDRVPPAFAAFKDAIEPVTTAIGDLINNHLEIFQGALAALGGAGIASVISLIGGGLVSALIALIGVLASPVVLIGALVGALIYAYTKSEKFREVVAQVVAWIKSDFIPGFLAMVDAVRGFATQVIPIIQDAVNGLIDRLAPLVPRVVEVFKQVWSTIKDVMALIGNIVKIGLAILIWEWQHFGQNVLDFIARTFKNVVTVISGVLNVIQGVVRLVLALIHGDWSGAWDALKQIVKGVWQIISGIVSQAVAQLQLVLSVAWALIKAGAAKAWDGIKKIPGLALAAALGILKLELNAIKALAQAAWNGIKAATQAVWSAIKSYISTQIGAVKSAVGGIADLVGKVRGWFGDILGAIKDKLGEAVAFVKSVPGKIGSALKAGVMVLYNAGKDMMLGFVNGVKSMATSLLNSAKQVVQGAIDGVKGLLHIGSPSKLFHQIGQWTMEGFENGITAGGPKVLNAMKDALDKTLDKVQSFRDGLKSKLDGVMSDFASLRDSIASAFTGDLFNVSAIASSLTDTTFTAAQSVGQVFADNLLSTKGHLKELLKAFRKLKGWGIPAQFLSQMFASGNSALILELAGGSRAQAQSDASLFGDVQSLSSQLGSGVARNQLGPELRDIRGELQHANNHLKHLDTLAKDLARALDRASAAAKRHAHQGAAA